MSPFAKMTFALVIWTRVELGLCGPERRRSGGGRPRERPRGACAKRVCRCSCEPKRPHNRTTAGHGGNIPKYQGPLESPELRASYHGPQAPSNRDHLLGGGPVPAQGGRTAGGQDLGDCGAGQAAQAGGVPGPRASDGTPALHQDLGLRSLHGRAMGPSVQGFTTLEELASSGQLTGQQKIGLKHFHDFLEKMPREEAGEIADTVAKAALSLQPGLTVVPCGSYRRGKSMCGDVDVLISHAELSALDGLLNRLLQLLRSSGEFQFLGHRSERRSKAFADLGFRFLTDDLAVPHGTGVPSKYMGVCRLDRPGSKGAEKRSLGSLVSTPTEASILEHLGLSYRPPEQREQL
uniref:DNA polymerase n=1 Tax=Ixodes scapularis TaxID=6945 RepID=A0A4D5RUR4_IXOSC